jgi:hypothetical protein
MSRALLGGQGLGLGLPLLLPTVDPILLDFCPPSVRYNVRMKSKFEFLKISNWVGHYIG